MEGGIDADAPLDYAVIQILPKENRSGAVSYEALIYSADKVEKLATGLLKELLPHLPKVNDLYAKGSNASFKLQLPGNLNGAAWFTKSILTRFLRIIGSADLIDVINAIEDEMFQLEETKKFHLSLYGQDCHNRYGTLEADCCNSIDVAPSSKLMQLVQHEQPEVNISSSDVSKSELLRAMDLRLTALRRELTVAFNKVVDDSWSCKEIADLVQFSQHFGATALKNSLYKVLEMNQESQHIDPVNDEKASSTCSPKNDNMTKADENARLSEPAHAVIPVKYGVSPAKVAEVERESSTESEELSDSSDEHQTSAERSRNPIRSASPRRLASPMRRIQIGRTGSRRAAALSIKSLNYFPARERALSHRDEAGNNGEDEGFEGPAGKHEINVHRISVQDAINLFESKQRDHVVDSQKRRSLTNISIFGNKSVLRRWSAGVGEASSQCQPEIVSEDYAPETLINAADVDISVSSVGVILETEFRSKVQNLVETDGADVGFDEEKDEGYDPRYTPADTNDFPAHGNEIKGEEIHRELTAAKECNRRNEAELDKIMVQVKENKPIRPAKPQTSRNKNSSSEQKCGFYDHCKEKRSEKLRGQNARKGTEKETQVRPMQQILNGSKAEMASKNGNDGKRVVMHNPQGSHKHSSRLVNPKREISKPSVTSIVSSKATPLPAKRKSWPSTPSPRTRGTSPGKTPGGISSAVTTPTRLKCHPAPSLPQPSLKAENSLRRQRNVKVTQSDHDRTVKGVNEKRQERMPSPSKTTKIKSVKGSGDCSGVVPKKPSFYDKVPKKSSVVPLDSKPFLRKGSRTVPGVSPVNKKKDSPQLDESVTSCRNLGEHQDSDAIVSASDMVSQHQGGDDVSLNLHDGARQSGTHINSHQQCGETETFEQVAARGDNDFNNKTESSVELQAEEESIISPSAWVEMEEHEQLPIPSDLSISQHASPANVAPVGWSSLRVRHSLSQMLQEESSEPESIEWGNAENPPVIVCQKDAPKGLKRLLKFARKSKGDANGTGWSSPSVFSEGEDDAEESKLSYKRNADNLLRKAALQAKNFAQQNTSLCENHGRSLDSGDLLPAQSNLSKLNDHFCSHKMQESFDSALAPATKAARSFFSLSAFRGSKPNETKHQ